MKELNLPSYSFRFKSGDGGKALIYDDIRRKYVVLTPEEWVRQHFVRYLVNEKSYPAGLLAVEASFELNRLVKRADILVHNRAGRPVLLVECKAPDVRLDAVVFDQIVTYNIKFRLRYIVVTNGMKHFACSVNPDTGEWFFMDKVPDYNVLNDT